jgi:predicted dehydrogenase
VGWTRAARLPATGAAPARAAGPAPRRCGIAAESVERVRYALVGCGVMGRQHAWYAYGDPASEVVRYVDADLGRARDLAARYGGAATAEYRAALDDPDVQGVILTVPYALHAPLAVQALAAGKHVMVEKPIARTLTDADALIAAAEAAGRVLFVAHVLRFKPALRRVKRLLDAGTLGVPVFARYHHEHRPDQRERGWLAAPEAGGVFVTGAVHHADLLRWWLGEVRAVTGHGCV